MKKAPAAEAAAAGRSLTIDQFCELEQIHLATYRRLQQRGLGPRELRVGNVVRISEPARLEWERQRENPKGNELAEIEARKQRFSEHARNAAQIRHSAATAAKRPVVPRSAARVVVRLPR
jgi:hypothetical protein